MADEVTIDRDALLTARNVALAADAVISVSFFDWEKSGAPRTLKNPWRRDRMGRLWEDRPGEGWVTPIPEDYPRPELYVGPFDAAGNVVMKGCVVRILCMTCGYEIMQGGSRREDCGDGVWSYPAPNADPMIFPDGAIFVDCGTLVLGLRGEHDPEFLFKDGVRCVGASHSSECMEVVAPCRI